MHPCIKIITLATDDSLCHCESLDCHPNEHCSAKAYWIVEAFGMKQFLCAACYQRTQKEE